MKAPRRSLLGKSEPTIRGSLRQRSFEALLIVITTAFLLQGAIAADRVDAVDTSARSCSVIRYSANPDYPPYHWQTSDRQLDGASIELLKMITPPNVRLEPQIYPWKRTLRMAKMGQVDLLVALRITPEREEFLQFTAHRAFPNPTGVFVHKDRQFVLNSWSDLKGKMGRISLGDTFGGGFDEYLRKELSFEETGTMANNFQELQQGKIAYFVTGLMAGQAGLLAMGKEQKIVPLPLSNSDSGLYFGFSRQSPCAFMVAEFSHKLEELDAKGIPQQLLQKYMSKFEERRTEFKH